jgi:hypothetical protein
MRCFLNRPNIRIALNAWGPCCLLMALLFVASAQPKYPPPGGEPTPVYFSGMMPIFQGAWDMLVKKTAHVIAYGVLALAYLYALSRSGVASPRAGYLAIALAACYAATDELHQAFVPGRTASALDVGVDVAGAALFVFVVRRYRPQIAARLDRWTAPFRR